MLVRPLRACLGAPSARSFQLLGDDLAILPGAALREAAAAYEAELARTVPAHLRADFEREQTLVLAAAHALLRRYNRSIHARIRGYLAFGGIIGFEYPWPVVAILGICEVMRGIARSRAFGLAGRLIRRMGRPGLEEAAGRMDDVLLRTNRGIFADSAPILLLAQRSRALRRTGRAELADALLAGPLPPALDEEARALAKALAAALDVPRGEERFHALAALTAEQFEREQAIFTYQMDPAPRAAPRRSAVGRARKVGAPSVDRRSGVPRVVFRSQPLPEGFDMRDHAARVAVFDRAFVRSITGSIADYQAAIEYAFARFGRAGERVLVRYGDAGAPLAEASLWDVAGQPGSHR